MVRDTISLLLLLAAVPFVFVAASRDEMVHTCNAQQWRDGTCAQFMGGNNMLQVTRMAQQTRRRTVDVDMDTDVAYGTAKEHKVDVYWPANLKKPEGGWPTVIIMHGKGNDKSGFKGFCTNYIVPSGRLCLAGSYRKDDQFRDGDIYDMFMWFWREAPTWDVDKENIVLSGFSLGSLTINNILWDKDMGKKLLEGSPAKVKAVMLLSGCWNHARAASKAKYFPSSTFIMSSNTDEVVPHEDSKKMYKELDEMGQKVHFVVIEDAGHNIMYSDKADEWYAEILQWLDSTIPGKDGEAKVEEAEDEEAEDEEAEDKGAEDKGAEDKEAEATEAEEATGGVAGGGVSKLLIDMDTDVAYGTAKEHKVDVYWPANLKKPEGGWPTVIIMHGKGNDKSGFKGFCTNYIVQSGRLCLAGSYRKDDQFRDGDIYDMFMWFWREAPTWDVDKENIVLSGFSLGSLTINNILWDKDMGKKLLEGSPAKVKAVMLLSGCWNHARAASKAKYFPSSTFIMSSNTDEVVPHEDSKKMYKELDEMGQKVHFVVIEDAGHNIMYSDKADEWYAEILQWLDLTIPGRN